jgi:gliding motility-associated protein GldM
MLALNVSREVMDFLYDDMKSKEVSISTIDNQNSSVYSAFAQAAQENAAKAGKWKDQAFEVRKRSSELYDEIDVLKVKLINDAGGYEEDENGKPTDRPKKMDNREKAAEYFITQKNGDKFKTKIDGYREFMAGQEGISPEIQANINQLFNTGKVKNKDGVEESWVSHNFEHYPLISVLSTLTTIQANIKNSEAQVITALKAKIGELDLKFTDVVPVVIPKSTFITQGDAYTAEVFLAAYDATQEPKVIINGQELSSEEIANGRGNVTLSGSTTGEHKWGGKIIIRQNGEDKEFQIAEQTYTVQPPSVVISPTAMNVLYRNVDNPLEIGVPGVDPSKVTASGPGVRRSGNGYIADVTKVKGKEISINVTVKNDDGTTKNMGSKKFRIKGLPTATGLVYKKSNTILSKNAIKQAKVEAEYQDFPFNLPLTVTSFEVKIEGFSPVQTKGNKFDSTTKKRIDKLKPGSTIIIRKIRAKTAKGAKVTKIGSISIDVN